MKTKVLSLILLLAGIVPAALAQQPDLEQQFARELKEKCSGLNSIQCRFTQTRSAAVLAHDAEKEGSYYFLQPYQVLLAFDDGDYIKITSTMFEIRQNGHTNSTKVGSNPMLKNLNRMLTACISGDAAQIVSGFRCAITADEREYRLELLPQQGRSAKKGPVVRLTFDRSDMSLKQMKMEEPSGDFLQYRFYDVTYNAAVDPSLFDIR